MWTEEVDVGRGIKALAVKQETLPMSGRMGVVPHLRTFASSEEVQRRMQKKNTRSGFVSYCAQHSARVLKAFIFRVRMVL